MTVAALRKLPLQPLLGPADAAGLDGSSPAYLSRETLQLCFTTRKQIYKLKDLELALLRAFSTQDPRPSILRGALVRFVSKQEYRMALVSETREEPAGQLMLRPQGFDRWVPATCLSNTCTLSDEKQWAERGREEVCALLRTLPGSMPTRREIAAACCRLSTGWLWTGQPEAFRAALAADPSAVAAQLEDPAAVAALLPCVEEPAAHSSRPPTPAAAAASAARAAAAFRQKTQQTGSDGPPSGGTTADGAAAGNAAPPPWLQPPPWNVAQQPEQRLPASPPWSLGTQLAAALPGQQQQQQQAQQQGGPAPKRQRTDSPSAGGGGQQQQQQQPGQSLLQGAVQQPAQAGQLPPPPPPPPPAAQLPSALQPSPQHPTTRLQAQPQAQAQRQAMQVQVQVQVQQARFLEQARQVQVVQHAQQVQQVQPQQAQQARFLEQARQVEVVHAVRAPTGHKLGPLWPMLKQSPTAGYAWMPAGGPLERGLMQAVHALTSSKPSEPRQLGDLGNKLSKTDFNYKQLCGGHTLTQCVHELYYRDLIVLYVQTAQQSRNYYFSALPARRTA